jgi:hypothetical protein
MNDRLKKVVQIVLWFGPWPKWFSLYLQSCRWNPTIDFIVICDAPIPQDIPENVRFIHYGFDDYKAFVADRLGITLQWDNPFKLCDIKPLLGYLHEDLIAGYDYWGFGDIDVVYGDIRRFIGEEELSHDVVSAHEHIVSGHFALIRNTERVNRLFRRIWHWRYLIGARAHKSFDERIFSLMFVAEKRKHHFVHRLLTPWIGGALLREQYSTSIDGLPWIDGTKNYPKMWFWRSGKLTADNAGDRDFLYVHFTHWASPRWTKTANSVWHDVDPLVRVSGTRPEAFSISAAGFADLPSPDRSSHESMHGAAQ